MLINTVPGTDSYRIMRPAGPSSQRNCQISVMKVLSVALLLQVVVADNDFVPDAVRIRPEWNPGSVIYNHINGLGMSVQRFGRAVTISRHTHDMWLVHVKAYNPSMNPTLEFMSVHN